MTGQDEHRDGRAVTDDLVPSHLGSETILDNLKMSLALADDRATVVSFALDLERHETAWVPGAHHGEFVAGPAQLRYDLYRDGRVFLTVDRRP